MIHQIKSIIKKTIPENILLSIYRIKPTIQITNTYLLKKNKLIESLHSIDKKYRIRELNINDSTDLKKFYGNQSTFEKTILARLNSIAWVGLAAIDSKSNTIAYVSWIIIKNIKFIKDFKIEINKNQFFVRHGYCAPLYRHQGLHTRMEQERINYCISNGANEIFIQIGSNNKKGHTSVINNGFIFFQKNYILRIPALGIHQELFSALKSPFRRVL